jgi:hypothetical protein
MRPTVCGFQPYSADMGMMAMLMFTCKLIATVAEVQSLWSMEIGGKEEDGCADTYPVHVAE